MSIHAKLSEEALGRLRRQKRNSSIASAVISILFISLIALALGFFLLPNILKESPTIVTYKAETVLEEAQEVKKVSSAIQKKPSAPAPTSARVITTSAVSATSIPVPDVPVTNESIEFGDGDDFGAGWGGDVGFGGGDGATFFNQSVKANRIAYVIDYSLSMKGERDKLMRQELEKSIGGLTGGIQFQMIFFSGPAWVAGSELPGFNYGSGKATVKGKGGHKYEWTGKGLHDWTPKGKREPVEWLDVTASQLTESLKIIKESPLSGGTDWENPLLMAFDMEPPPQVVFFMTDGAVGGRDMMELVKDLASVANRKGIVVNTIAMMEPKAIAPMADLAKRTKGEFTIIEAGGKVRKVEAK